MSTVTPKVGQTDLEDLLASFKEDLLGEDQREEGLIAMSDLMNVWVVVVLSAVVVYVVTVLACIVWAVRYSVTCCTRRYQVVRQVQLEDNFKLVEQRVQAQRAARKAAARAAALPRELS